MLPLMEMMMKAQGRDGFAALQKQFGLDAKQAEQAMEALMPAFAATRLRRSQNACRESLRPRRSSSFVPISASRRDMRREMVE